MLKTKFVEVEGECISMVRAGLEGIQGMGDGHGLKLQTMCRSNVMGGKGTRLNRMADIGLSNYIVAIY